MRLNHARPLTWADRLVLYALVGVAVVLFAAGGAGGGGRSVHIEGVSTSFDAPLDDDRVVEVEGPLGMTVVAVEGGAARIVSSPCPHGTCVAMGSVSEAGQAVVCVPNRVVVRVEGGSAATDATTR